jgi:hypothetical protein
MTRVVTIDDTPEAVTALCAKFGIGISVIEPLPSGGTCVILNNGVDAEKVRREMKAKLIAGPSVRSSLYVARIRAPQS